MNSVERAKIDLLNKQGLTGPAIASKIDRSFSVAYSHLKNKSSYSKKMNWGKKTAKIAVRREILRSASNSSDSAAKIKQKAGVTASVSTVRRVTNSKEHF